MNVTPSKALTCPSSPGMSRALSAAKSTPKAMARGILSASSGARTIDEQTDVSVGVHLLPAPQQKVGHRPAHHPARLHDVESPPATRGRVVDLPFAEPLEVLAQAEDVGADAHHNHGMSGGVEWQPQLLVELREGVGFGARSSLCPPAPADAVGGSVRQTLRTGVLDSRIPAAPRSSPGKCPPIPAGSAPFSASPHGRFLEGLAPGHPGAHSLPPGLEMARERVAATQDSADPAGDGQHLAVQGGPSGTWGRARERGSPVPSGTRSGSNPQRKQAMKAVNAGKAPGMESMSRSRSSTSHPVLRRRNRPRSSPRATAARTASGSRSKNSA